VDQTSDPAFHQLLDSARAAEAIRSRSGLGALRNHRAEDASVTGLLSNLSDLQIVVALTTTGGLEFRGAIELVGATGVMISSPSGLRSLLRLGGIVSIRTSEPCRLAGDGMVSTSMSMSWPTMVATFTEEVDDITVVIGDHMISGRLKARSRSLLELQTPNTCSYYAVVEAIDVVSAEATPIGSSVPPRPLGSWAPIVPGSMRQD